MQIGVSTKKEPGSDYFVNTNYNSPKNFADFVSSLVPFPHPNKKNSNYSGQPQGIAPT